MGDLGITQLLLYLIFFVVFFAIYAAFKVRRMWSKEAFLTVFIRTMAIYPVVILIVLGLFLLEKYVGVELSFIWQILIIMVILFIAGAKSESYFSKRVKYFEKGPRVMLVSSAQIEFNALHVDKVEQQNQYINVHTTSPTGVAMIKTIRVTDDSLRKELAKRIKMKVREEAYANKH